MNYVPDEMQKHLREVDRNTVDPLMSLAIRRFHFFTLWKRDASEREFFECCDKVRRYVGLEPYNFAKFDNGWQYRIVLHPEYKVARDEFFNLCYGWW